MQPYRFIEADLLSAGHSFARDAAAAAQSSAGGEVMRRRLKRITEELGVLSTSLPLSWDSSILLAVHSDRLDVLRAALLPHPDTPYGGGAFLFDILLPPEYPDKPPRVRGGRGGRGGGEVLTDMRDDSQHLPSPGVHVDWLGKGVELRLLQHSSLSGAVDECPPQQITPPWQGRYQQDQGSVMWCGPALTHDVLCYVVLCCAVLCCAVLCCVVLFRSSS
jgi:hypothetical protein